MSVVELTEESYEKTRTRPGIVVIEWHNPDDAARLVAPEGALSDGEITLATIDAGAQSTQAALAHVTSTPTTLIYRDGYEVFRGEDALDPEDLQAVLASVRDLDMEDVRLKAAMRDADDHRGG
jgi:thioredoxin 1